MLIIPSSFFQSLGLGAIIVVLVTLAATFTLLPANLAFLGPRVNMLRLPFIGRAPSSSRSGDSGGGFRDAITRAVTRFPIVSLVLVVGVMVAAAAFFFQINTGNNGIDAFPEGSFTRDAFFILEEEGFSFGVIKPTQIVIDGNVDSPEVQGAIEKLTTSIESDPRFPLPPALEVFAEANLAVLSVLIAGEPRSQSAADAVTAIREQHIPGAFNGVPAEAIVGGLSAADADFRGFHRHSAMILQAFAAGVLVEGFTTNIARSFIITGRLRDQGVRRLQNNNRHVMEIFWPKAWRGMATAGNYRFEFAWFTPRSGDCCVSRLIGKLKLGEIP